MGVETKVKRPREFFTPYLETITKNFVKAKQQLNGDVLKNLYIFGSYAKASQFCGDIDILYTINQEKLDSIMYTLQGIFFATLSTKEKKEVIDFTKCDEYPDCKNDYRCLPNCVKYDECSWVFGEHSELDDCTKNQIMDELKKTIEQNVSEHIKNWYAIEDKPEEFIHLCSTKDIKEYQQQNKFGEQEWKYIQIV